MLGSFFVKAHSENLVVCHGSRTTQWESRLMSKAVQPLQGVQKCYNSHARVVWLWFGMILNEHTSLCEKTSLVCVNQCLVWTAYFVDELFNWVW
jgi:hypothetical protein